MHPTGFELSTTNHDRSLDGQSILQTYDLEANNFLFETRAINDSSPIQEVRLFYRKKAPTSDHTHKKLNTLCLDFRPASAVHRLGLV